MLAILATVSAVALPASGIESAARTCPSAANTVGRVARSDPSAPESAAGTTSGPGAAPSAQGGAAGARASWRIRGNLSEACTCSVPCTCNFGEASSPHHYCHAIFSLDIRKGSRSGVKLDGLRLACGNAAKGSVWYIDERATPPQAASLRAIAEEINQKLIAYWRGVDPKIIEDPQFTLLGFEPAQIVQRADDRGSMLEIGRHGGFVSDFILGIDGKTPVIVENNWSWNIQHGIKGKTRRLRYEDEHGNTIDASATNANEGRFDWSDRTPIYLR